MTKRGTIIGIFITLFFVGISVSTSLAFVGFDVGARGIYWMSSLDADMQTSLDPQKIDLKDDLNFQDKDFGSGEVFLRFGRNHLTVSYTTLSYSALAKRAVTFNGQNFNVNSESRLEYDQIDGIYQYDLIRFNPVIARFNIGPILQVTYVDGFAELKQSGTTERKDFSAPIPMVGVGAGVGILKDMVILEARVAGLEVSGNRAIDGQAVVGFVPFPFLKIFGGYRIFDLKVDDSDLKLNYTLDGPIAGIQVSF